LETPSSAGTCPDDDRQPQAEHEPGLHGRRGEAGHEPDVQDPEHHQHDADQDGQGRRQVAEAGRVARGHGRDQRRRGEATPEGRMLALMQEAVGCRLVVPDVHAAKACRIPPSSTFTSLLSPW
jgi:hypothetical protein